MLCFVIGGQVLLAQGPPNPPVDPSLQGPPVGGGAPIGGGLEMLLIVDSSMLTNFTVLISLRSSILLHKMMTN